VSFASGYVVTQNGTVHRYPALEQCNLDIARIAETFERLPVSRANIVIPPGRPCKHCKPLDDAPLPLPPVDPAAAP